jgi:hypothetical protein
LATVWGLVRLSTEIVLSVFMIPTCVLHWKKLIIPKKRKRKKRSSSCCKLVGENHGTKDRHLVWINSNIEYLSAFYVPILSIYDHAKGTKINLVKIHISLKRWAHLAPAHCQSVQMCHIIICMGFKRRDPYREQSSSF